MTDRPILFARSMVRAILDGRKTVTRRIVTVPWKGNRRTLPYEPYWVDTDGELFACDEYGDYHHVVDCMQPYGAAGDRLYVRETWIAACIGNGNMCVVYRASCNDDCFDFVHGDGSIEGMRVARWRPSIHMPREASRLTLEVVAVRVERLQDITEEDARAEGVEWIPHTPFGGGGSIGAFANLWDEINAERATWKSNPWVWRVEFRRVP